MSSPWKINYARYKRFLFANISKYQKKQELRAYLEILLSLATIIIFSVFALRPTLLIIAQLVKEIDEKENIIASMDQKIENLEKAQRLYNKEIKNINILYSSIPTSPFPDVFVRQIEGLSEKHSVGVMYLSVGQTTLLGDEVKKEKDENVSPLPPGSLGMPISIGATSSYEDLIQFLSSIETIRRPLKFDTLEFKTSTTEDGKFLLLTIRGRVPFYEDIYLEKVAAK